MVGYFKPICSSSHFFIPLIHFNPYVGPGGSGGVPGLGLGTGAGPVGGYGPGTVGSGFAGAGLPGSAVGAGSRGGLGPGYGTGAGGNLNQSE